MSCVLVLHPQGCPHFLHIYMWCNNLYIWHWSLNFDTTICIYVCFFLWPVWWWPCLVETCSWFLKICGCVWTGLLIHPWQVIKMPSYVGPVACAWSLCFIPSYSSPASKMSNRAGFIPYLMTQAELANEITQEHLMGGVPAPISPHCTATLSISHFPVKCTWLWQHFKFCHSWPHTPDLIILWVLWYLVF